MKDVFMLTAILSVLPLCVSGTIYYVDAGSKGSDSNSGKSIDDPFKTISTCINALNAGDECHIRAGRYHEPEFTISGKRGRVTQPIVICGYGNEMPVIDGTIPLRPRGSSTWVRGTDGVYSAVIDQDIWQLFVDEEMMTNARWPNALWSNKTVFLNSHWAKSSGSSTHLSFPPLLSTMVDNGAKDLAGSDLNVTGAMAVLNIGSFNTFTGKVENHVPRSSSFTYKDTFGSIKFKPSSNQYFLEDKLDFLDNAGEWFFNQNTKTVYVKTPDGASPAGRIRGKVQTYAFKISNCQHLHFKQLTFFGTTLKTLPANKRKVIDGLLFHSINFSFPSYSKRMLGVTNPPLWTYIRPTRGRSFNLTNCTFHGSDGLALQYFGDGVLLQNNLFEYNDWSVANAQTKNGGHGTVISQGVNDKFIRNTLRFNGAAHGYRPNGANPTVSLNHIHHQCWGVLQHDGAGIQFQIPAQKGSTCQKNWVHSSPKPGLRFDAAAPPRVGEHGTMEDNVVWKCGGIIVKGNRHHVLKNLLFDKRSDSSGSSTAPGCTLCVRKYFPSRPLVEMNNETVTQQNAADVANGGRSSWPLPGLLMNNIIGPVRPQLVDADNLDFRPHIHSTYNALNVGPYRYDPSSRVYWIPGRQLYKASTPVPPHKSTTVKFDRNAVMWLNAFGASIHRVYFGTTMASVANATPTSAEHKERIINDYNVHYLSGSLVRGSTYYWRVDAEIDATTTYKGDVWSFRTV